MTASRYTTDRGLKFVVTVTREDAAYLTNPAEPLAERGGCLHELLSSGQAHAGGSRVPRGWVAIAVLAVVPRQMAFDLLAVEPRGRRRQAAVVTGCDHTLFCGASLAEPDAPAVEYHGVPMSLVRTAEESLAALDAARYAPFPPLSSTAMVAQESAA